MPRSRMLALPIALAAVLAPALPAAAADLCLRAAEEAARKTGVPLQLLLAVTLTETGRRRDGALHPWPWALNRGGEGLWFATEEEALAVLSDAVAQGTTNIDVGCFQLNYRWHSAAFASLEQMLDPRANALHAARLLARHAAEQGDWIAAAGAYHSATPEKAAAYLARLEPNYAGLGGTDSFIIPPAEDAGLRVNGFPLLVAGQSASAGSLVPRAAGGRPLFGGP
ncbi:lytic transglycosylase domain-containing protein [Rhodobacter sp. SGA-6-6]|uniref:transglycosylase SLT domain-containing protein n=1 Tax=Rhodobacter sp. SGA-6-6 TaxID=2710882 RepID=UPI0013EB42D4|nr:transglycosylase SLT domain-containing protein [Rhodobacter sp. SGA-6-6]NGM44403.1 lytic transglycosylase domain-containing protein [Rhodobacter sp. SGA-6-6]